MHILSFINFLIAGFFMVCYSYQFFYIFYSLIRKPKKPPEGAAPKRYAVLISARNEELVIGQLIESIKAQEYPKDMVDIYVVADNCSDKTAEIARGCGATVFERFHKEKIGKGYALEFLFSEIRKLEADKPHDGYFIFDADNLLDKNYIAEMNKVFSSGYKIVTSYRNSKNYGTSWVSSGYSLWFLREAKYLNNPRMMLKTSCAVSGTGFLVSHDVVERNGGWKFFLLTEDIEFTVDSILKGDKIGYCGTAVLYDEQPITFAQSWRQRLRWARGYLQVFRYYGAGLFRGMFSKNGFSCLDMTMNIMPAIVLTMISFVLNLCVAIMGLALGQDILPLLYSVFETLRNAYLLLFGIGLITGITEWKNIRSSLFRKLLSFITFPLFMFTYIPISFVALFKNPSWKPITHTVAISVEDLNG